MKKKNCYLMSSLFIFGNGFDIAHGIPSKYSDFRSFIVGQFPEALNFRDEVVYLEDTENIDTDEFAAEILLSTMDKAAGKDWCNFEEALALVNFDKKLPRPNHKENETPEEDHALMGQYLLYMDMLTSGFINCSKLWEEFFRLWLKGIQQEIDNGKYTPKDHLTKLFAEPGAQFLTFNYTKTLQRLYGVKKVIHIHNRVGQKLVWGHEKENVSYNQFNSGPDCLYIGSSFLDDKRPNSNPIVEVSTLLRISSFNLVISASLQGTRSHPLFTIIFFKNIRSASVIGGSESSTSSSESKIIGSVDIRLSSLLVDLPACLFPCNIINMKRSCVLFYCILN